jgi:hypothetical protein
MKDYRISVDYVKLHVGSFALADLIKSHQNLWKEQKMHCHFFNRLADYS